MIYLNKLNYEDSEKEYRFFRETPSENGFMNEYHNITFDEFINDTIPKRINSSQGNDLPEGRVPYTYYFLWDDCEIVGLFKIRHYLNESLRNGAGHLGYTILPKHRCKGYATIGLGLVIEEFKKIAIPEENEIYLSCHKDNETSLKVQLKNGAYIHHSDEKVNYTIIRID